MLSTGMSRHTGRWVTGWPHVIQSIGDILTTRVLQRVMLREYGGGQRELVDMPMTEATIVVYYSAVATALALWEPRFELTDIDMIDAGPDGRVALRLSGIYYPRGHLGDRTPSGDPVSLTLDIGSGGIAVG